MPTQVGDADDVIRGKLTIAVWAAETLRSALDFRGLSAAVRTPALGYLGVDAAWAEPLQDAFLSSALTLCQQAPWAVDPGQSQGLLSGSRMAFLALMQRISAVTSNAATSRARLQAAVTPGDFQLCEAALLAAGKTFDDITWEGGAWSLRTDTLASGSSTVGGASSVAGSGAGVGAPGSSYSGLSSVSHLGADAARRVRQAACEQDYRGLKYDIYSLLTASENVDQKSRAKYAAPGDKRERAWEGDEDVADVDASATPLARYPWNQSLRVYPSLSLSMLGRILRIALTFCNRDVREQMTQVVFKQAQQEQTKLYNNFLQVAPASWAEALVMVPLFFGIASTTMRAAASDARQRCALFPESRFLSSVEQKRADQAASLEQFTEAVLQRVSSEVSGAPAHARAECAVLMWAEFLGGWMATSFSGQYCDDMRRQWMSVQRNMPSDGHAGRAQRLSHDGGYASPDGGSSGGGGGGGGSGGAAPLNQGKPGAISGGQEFRRTIPCSIDIVGDTLGVVSPYPCKGCKPSGRHHSGAECPKRWGKVGIQLPGFLLDGTRDPSAWRGNKEPIRATIAAWIAFIQEPSNFLSNGPMQAGVTGAPKLEDFQRRLAQAPAKP